MDLKYLFQFFLKSIFIITLLHCWTCEMKVNKILSCFLFRIFDIWVDFMPKASLLAGNEFRCLPLLQQSHKMTIACTTKALLLRRWGPWKLFHRLTYLIRFQWLRKYMSLVHSLAQNSTYVDWTNNEIRRSKMKSDFRNQELRLS